MLHGLIRAFCIFAISLFPAIAFSVTKTPVSNVEVQLVSIIAKVNQKLRVVRPNEELVVIKGDELEILSANLNPAHSVPSFINLVGFAQADDLKKYDDRNIKINTGTELKSEWSKDKAGDYFVIKVGHKSKIIGMIGLRVIAPELKYANFNVGGETYILRPGQISRFKSSDKFTVKEIVTNIENDRQTVDYQVIPLSETMDVGSKIRFFELRFLRNGLVFAKLPLQIEEK